MVRSQKVDWILQQAELTNFIDEKMLFSILIQGATTVFLEDNIPIEQVSKWLENVDISSIKIQGKLQKAD